MRHKSFRYAVISIVGLLYFVLNVSTYVVPEWFVVNLSLFLLVLFVITTVTMTIWGFLRRQQSPRWWLPAFACLAITLSGWLAAPVGRFIADARFKRHLPEYSAVVDQIRDGSISCPPTCNTRLEILDIKQRPYYTRSVLAARCSDGPLMVSFLLDVGVPLLHEGYMFKDENGARCSTDAMRMEVKCPYVRHVIGNWFHFSDQPGL